MKRTLVALLLVSSPVSGLAQEHQPYAGMQQRQIKALSDDQIADLRAGRGLGMALPAELNGYPGPIHVLESAEALNLTADQRARSQTLYEQMKAEAIPLGQLLIEQEANLDRLFASRQITPEMLTSATGEIGATEARLREAHLKYHLAMMDVLSPDQVERYRHLRGYASHTDGHGRQH